jgi:hypothetical protein
MAETSEEGLGAKGQRWEDGVMEDTRKLGQRNCRNAARNRDRWQKLLKKALVQKRAKLGRWCDGRWQEVGGEKLEEWCKE